jgi:6-phosphogluconolactonase
MSEADIWVGTYTRKEGHVDGKAKGIYRLHYEDDSLSVQATLSDIINPSFIERSPNGDYLYAVSEIGPGADSSGYVYAYAIDDDEPQMINRQPSYAFAPCHVSIHPNGKWLYVANYVGGMIVRYPLERKGVIGMATDTLRLSGNGPHARQEGSHPHSVTVSPDGKWVMAADLGTDEIHTFRADQPTWELVSTATVLPGSGPRHLAFHPKAPYAYVLNELSSTVTAFHYNSENGALNRIDDWPTLPRDFSGENTAGDIHISPDGQFLYASNRGDNSLAGFRINPADGQLESTGYFSTRGETPRNFVIHPEGKTLLVANQDSDNLVQLIIDEKNGKLRYEQEWEVKTPVCLVFE